MPMNWDAEANAKLFTAIITTCGVSLGGDNLKKVAAMLGPECTPKAVTHQIAKIKSTAKTLPGAADGTFTTSATPRKRAAPGSKVKSENGESPKAKKPRASKGSKKSAAKVKSEDEDDAGEGAKSVTPASMKGSDEDEAKVKEERDDDEVAEQQIQLENGGEDEV